MRTLTLGVSCASLNKFSMKVYKSASSTDIGSPYPLYLLPYLAIPIYQDFRELSDNAAIHHLIEGSDKEYFSYSLSDWTEFAYKTALVTQSTLILVPAYFAKKGLANKLQEFIGEASHLDTTDEIKSYYAKLQVICEN